ncbi:hypothetical protein ACMFMG_012063 [Clarireedia jacksonii]
MLFWLLFALFSLYIIRRLWEFLRLRHIAGPFWAGLSGWPHTKALLQNDCHQWYANVCNEYGPVVRIAPNLLITSSPDVWAHVNTKPGYKRSDWFYHALRSEHRRDSVFTQTDKERHQRRRKEILPGLTVTKVPDIETAVNENLQQLLNLIKTKYISSDIEIVPVDLARKLQYFLIDSISTVVLGKTFGNLQSDSDTDGSITAIEEAFVLWAAALAFGVDWLPQVPFIGPLFLPSIKDKKGFGKFMSRCFSYVDQSAANMNGDESHTLASFIRNGVVGDELHSEALLIMTIGSINPLGAISGTLLHVITNPRVYSKLQDEVNNAVRDGKAPAAGEGLISSAQARQLPYLQATIREGMRLWPPVDGLFARDVPPGGDTIFINGKPVFLPGGVSIARSVTSMFQSKETYGNDADSFRPERWIGTNSDKITNMVRTSDLLYNYGNDQCLGKGITQVEMGKTIFELLRNFKFAVNNPTRPWNTVNTFGLFTIKDMWVQVEEQNTGI